MVYLPAAKYARETRKPLFFVRLLEKIGTIVIKRNVEFLRKICYYNKCKLFCFDVCVLC